MTQKTRKLMNLLTKQPLSSTGDSLLHSQISVEGEGSAKTEKSDLSSYPTKYNGMERDRTKEARPGSFFGPVKKIYSIDSQKWFLKNLILSFSLSKQDVFDSILISSDYFFFFFFCEFLFYIHLALEMWFVNGGCLSWNFQVERTFFSFFWVKL